MLGPSRYGVLLRGGMSANALAARSKKARLNAGGEWFVPRSKDARDLVYPILKTPADDEFSVLSEMKKSAS